MTEAEKVRSIRAGTWLSVNGTRGEALSAPYFRDGQHFVDVEITRTATVPVSTVKTMEELR